MYLDISHVHFLLHFNGCFKMTTRQLLLSLNTSEVHDQFAPDSLHLNLCFKVAMREWIHQNFGEIVLMYEDRFDLRVLKLEPYPEAAEKLKENYNWWTRFTLRKCATVQPSLLYSIISSFPLTLKRTKELRALKGWYTS